jgi:hypothetical protein
MIKELIRKPTQDDVEYLIDHVRPEDIEEVDAFDGSTIRESLEATPDLLENSEVWEVDGKVVCMFGVTPIDEFEQKVGMIWMLATPDFDKYSRMFAVRCQKVVEKMVSGYEFIYNYVHSKNEKSVAWLRWLGFKTYDPEPLGPRGEMFTRFEMKRCAIQ